MRRGKRCIWFERLTGKQQEQIKEEETGCGEHVKAGRRI